MGFDAMQESSSTTSDPTLVLADVQTLLHHSSEDRLDEDIVTALRIVAQAQDADRGFLFMIKDTVFVQNTHEWVAPGIKPVQKELKETSYHAGEIFWDAFRGEGILALTDISSFPAGSEMHKVLVQQEIKSVLAAPLWNEGEISGFVGFDFCRTPRTFDARDSAFMRSIAASLSSALKVRELTQQRNHLETDLHAAKDRISSMVRALPELLLETDCYGVVIGFHQSPPLTLALSPEEVIGRAPEQFLPAHVAAIARKAMAQVDASGWSETLSYSINIDGRAKRFALHATRRGTSDPRRAQGYLFVVRDVTESYEQTHHLRLLARAADHSSNLIMLTDEGQRVTWMNPAAIARTGFSMDAAMGHHPADILRQSPLDSGTANDLRLKLEQLDHSRQEVLATSCTGLPYWLDLQVQSLRHADGGIQGYMLVASDISVHKLAEARALREQISVMDLSDDSIAITQPDGHIAFMNSALRRAMNIAADTDVTTLTWHDINPDSVKEQYAEILPELYAKGHWNGEMIYPHYNAAERYFDVSIWVQSDGTFLSISRDITDRKASEKNNALLREQLHIAQSRQQIAHLAGGLAHDIFNYLAVITHTIEIMKEDAGRSDDESLTRMEYATAQVLSLVKNMGKLSRRETLREIMDIRPIVKQSTDLLRPSLGGEAVLSLSMPAEPVCISCDPTELMQALINLMINARDALRPEEGTRPQISVQVRSLVSTEKFFPVDLGTISHDLAYAIIEIRDTGIGLSNELKQKMFDPYFTTKGDNGTGLGMSIIAGILLSNQAALRIESEPGEGTCAQVFWPIAAEPSTVETKKLASEHITSLLGLNVLLAGDDESALAEMSKLLSHAGAEVASCACPEEAISAVADDPGNWDVIVANINNETTSVDTWAESLQRMETDCPVILTVADKLLHFATCFTQNEKSTILYRADMASVLETLSHHVRPRMTH